MYSQTPASKPPSRPNPSSEASTTALGILAAVIVGSVVALPALLLAGVLWLLMRGNRGRMLVALLVALIGWGALYLYHTPILAAGQALFRLLSQLRAGHVTWAAFLPLIFGLWRHTWPAAPTLALLIESLRPRTFAEQHAALQAVQTQRERGALQAALRQVRKAPEAIKGAAVLGARVSAGDATAFQHGPWAVYPPELLNRHAVVLGASGTGKTELVLRLAYLARKVYGWRVFYLDAKGDHGTAARFVTAMQQAGVSDVKQFPEQPFHGWRGSATEIFNRLMSAESFSEPYYRAMTKLMLSLACQAPQGPPRRSDELLRRLKLAELADCYKGHPQLDDVLRIPEKEANGTYGRYRALFSALHGALDGQWAWEDAQAGYVLLDGLALKEEARGLGRYLLEDFGQAMVKRLAPGERVLLIVDEYSALAGAAEAEGLFERVRSPHGVGGAGVVVTAQSYAALGDSADRMLQAAATTVLFQCADPEPLIRRAGSRAVYRTNVAGTLRHSQLTVGRTTGQASLREDEAPSIHPDLVRRLPVGACVLLATGGFQQLCVARLPHAPVARPTLRPSDAAPAARIEPAIRWAEAIRPAPKAGRTADPPMPPKPGPDKPEAASTTTQEATDTAPPKPSFPAMPDL